MVKDKLDRKFIHKTLYKNSNLTVKDFLELAAESRSFNLSQKKVCKSDKLLDDVEIFNVLVCKKHSVKLTNEETEYFNKRRIFWRKWQEDFAKKYFKGLYNYNNEYIQLQNQKKKEIPQYLQAISKVKISNV